MPRPAFVLPAELYQRAAYGSRLPEAVGQGISSYIQERKEKERLELQERILNENRRLKQLELQLGISKEMMIPQTGMFKYPQAGMGQFTARAPLPTIGAGLPPQRLTEGLLSMGAGVLPQEPTKGLRLPIAPRQATFEEAGLMMGKTIPEYLRGAYAYRAPEKVDIAGLAGLAKLGIAEKELGLKYPKDKKGKEIYAKITDIARGMAVALGGGYTDKQGKPRPILDKQSLMSTLGLMGIDLTNPDPAYNRLREIANVYPTTSKIRVGGVIAGLIPGGKVTPGVAIRAMQTELRKDPTIMRYIEQYGQSVPTESQLQYQPTTTETITETITPEQDILGIMGD